MFAATILKPDHPDVAQLIKDNVFLNVSQMIQSILKYQLNDPDHMHALDNLARSIDYSTDSFSFHVVSQNLATLLQANTETTHKLFGHKIWATATEDLTHNHTLRKIAACLNTPVTKAVWSIEEGGQPVLEKGMFVLVADQPNSKTPYKWQEIVDIKPQLLNSKWVNTVMLASDRPGIDVHQHFPHTQDQLYLQTTSPDNIHNMDHPSLVKKAPK